MRTRHVQPGNIRIDNLITGFTDETELGSDPFLNLYYIFELYQTIKVTFD
jgi:hypothetical protein